jgi:starch phosphorylase
VRVEGLRAGPTTDLRVGNEIDVQARVHLGPITPQDVSVEVYLGQVDSDGEIIEAAATLMQPVPSHSAGRAGPDESNSYLFEASAVPCRRSGLHGYTVRVLPQHPDLVTSFLPGLITWANPDVRVT